MKAMRYKIARCCRSCPSRRCSWSLPGGPAVAAPPRSAAGAVTSSSLGSFKPTFTGPAATGCAGCHLLTGPFRTPSTAHLSSEPVQQRTRVAGHGKGHAITASPGARARQ